MTTTRSSRTTNAGGPGNPASGGTRPSRRTRWPVVVLAVLVLAGLAIPAVAWFSGTRTQDSGTPAELPGAARTAPTVGGDLHTVTAVGGALYLGGHQASAVSGNGGRTWTDIPSLQNADAMGWAAPPGALVAGGHPGLFRSTDGGKTFSKMQTDFADVHGLGGVGNSLYLASPESGLLASSDGGATWEVKNSQVGQSFMGTILVDPADPNRLIAPDMAGGLMTSADGGVTWKALGGPMGAMAAAWDPRDTEQIIAVGMQGGAISTDRGATWKDLALPAGTSAVTYSEDGSVLYAGVLQGVQGVVYRSTDGGASWSPTA